MTGSLRDCAVLMIDMQNSFLHCDGQLYRGGLFTGRDHPLVNIPSTVKANRMLLARARSASTPVIMTRHCYRPDYLDASASTREAYQTRFAGALVAGSWDAALIDELEADAGTAVIDKTRMDAFYQTNLEAVLRELSVTRLLIGGVITNACVETTARSAAMRDFDVTVLSDCCTTYSGLDQANSLSGLQGFGLTRVMELADLTEVRS